MPDGHPLRPDDPAELGGHRILRLLGEGNQGVVYLGLSPSGEQVAIKLLHARMAEDPGARERFVRELSAAKKVARFCTAQVLEADVAGDHPYIVSEYVAGRSLRAHILEEGPRTGGALERLAIGTLTALAAIHKAGVVHRDFTPHNVLLGPDGPRVIDFGIARALGATRSDETNSVGTPSYMAPEQVSGREVGPPADMFAWGSTILFAATGRPPFGNDAVHAVMDRIMESEADVSALPEPLRSVVASCLAKDPAQRPTAQHAQAQLLGDEATGTLMPPPAFGAMKITAAQEAGDDLAGFHHPVVPTAAGTSPTLVNPPALRAEPAEEKTAAAPSAMGPTVAADATHAEPPTGPAGTAPAAHASSGEEPGAATWVIRLPATAVGPVASGPPAAASPAGPPPTSGPSTGERPAGPPAASRPPAATPPAGPPPASGPPAGEPPAGPPPISGPTAGGSSTTQPPAARHPAPEHAAALPPAALPRTEPSAATASAAERTIADAAAVQALPPADRTPARGEPGDVPVAGAPFTGGPPRPGPRPGGSVLTPASGTGITGRRNPRLGWVVLAGAAVVVAGIAVAIPLWPGGGDAATAPKAHAAATVVPTTTPSPAASTPPKTQVNGVRSGVPKPTPKHTGHPAGCRDYEHVYTMLGTGTVVLKVAVCRDVYSGTAVLADSAPKDGWDICVQLRGHLTGPGPETYMSTTLTSRNGRAQNFKNGPTVKLGAKTKRTEDFVNVNAGKCKGSGAGIQTSWQTHERLATA